MNPATQPPLLGAAGEDLRACVHCGFCLPACPTYVVLGDENDSPRGRLVLMQAAANGEVSLDGAFQTHIGRCLGCRACEPVCPAGVRYGHLLEQARGDLAGAAGSKPVERLALHAMTSATAAPWVYAIARAARAVPALMALGMRLPGKAGRLVALLDATRPDPAASEAGRSGRARQTREPAASDEAYVLLEGCVMSGLFGHVHAATRRVLSAVGAEESTVSGQTCCGALHAHAGFLDRARTLATANIEAFESVPRALIVTNSAGCGAAMRDYPNWFSHGDPWRTRADKLAARVRDVSEVIVDRSSALPPMRLDGTVAYDAPCHLVHAQRVDTPPIDSLEQIEGLSVYRLPSADRCCGGAGLYNLTESTLADRVVRPKLAEIEMSGCDWVATGNPGCVMFIGVGLRNSGSNASALHPVELLDRAMVLGARSTGG